MSETEDFRAVTEGDEASVIEEQSVSEGVIDESNVSGHGREDFAKEESDERSEEVKEKQEEERCEEKKTSSSEWEKKEAPRAASVADAPSPPPSQPTTTTTATTTATPTTPLTDGADPPSSEEWAGSIDARRQDRANPTGPGVGERIEKPTERRTDVGDGRRGENAAVGEWNSLPLLVERLRAALELTLESGSASSRRRSNDYPLPEDSGIDSEEDQRMRNSMEQAVVANDADLKNDLKFLEDLLLSDIETALSRLRETLERIDVNALTKHGAASDPSSKLQLLRLVSSLLSRLQVPQSTEQSQQPPQQLVPEVNSPVAVPTTARRRSRTRHTIGVSAEEIASARKWLEDERSLQCDLIKAGGNSTTTSASNYKEELITCANEIANIERIEKLSEEVHDKDKKDAINHRQSLLDKTKDCRVETIDNREVSKVSQPEAVAVPVITLGTDMNNFARRPSVGSIPDSREDDENSSVNEAVEEISRVGKLAAVLRQRAELAYGGKCTNNNNKFMAKRTKIKRANTIDIPSYLKMQAESLGRDNVGCVSLRKPINVSDKASTGGNNIVPSFQPKTENDRKFLALINKNSDAPSTNAPPPFKTFGYTKTTDLSSVTNENWNSRFSNMKTAFEKTPSSEKSNHTSIQTSRQERRPSGVPHASQKYQNAMKEKPFVESTYICNGASIGQAEPTNAISVGFRHAPSSPFRKIEKAPAPQASPIKPMPTYHWLKNNAPAPGNTLREKARMMFDREKNQPQYSQYAPRQKFEPEDITEKRTFPRPAWIEHDRNEGKINGAAVENGKIDYRSFCKQFAPFVGKNNSTDIKAREFEQWRQRDAKQYHAVRDSKDAIRDKHPGVVEGKISFKAIPDKHTIIQPKRREHSDKRGKKLGVTMTDTFNSLPKHEPEFPKANYDATLHGSATVGVQTGYDDEVPNEVRSFRVAPKISHGAPSLCSNASVQTTNDMEQAKTPEIQWKLSPYDYHESNSNYLQENRHPLGLDRNENYHYDSKDATKEIAENHADNPRYQNVYGINEQTCNVPVQVPFVQMNYNVPKYEEESYGQDSHFGGYHDTVASCDTSRHVQPETEVSQLEPTWNEDRFADDENIANQDISPDTGVVTRYTCAIATVASSIDSPEPKSEEGLGLSISQASSTPSPLSQSYLQSRPATNEQALSEDEEIRRHNMLQQSLIRRLQKSSGGVTDQRIDHPIGVTSQPIYSRPTEVSQPTKFLSPISRKPDPPPPQVVIPSSGSSVANRVTALREAYEQPALGVSKPIQKERSPIPNGINPIDTSDEYLVSCANKSSRSIVLSKSESWHQLAQPNSFLRVPRTATTPGSPPQLLPKPPKSKSPSSLKLRHKQFEASSAADSVKKMEDKIRRYFDSPSDNIPDSKDSRNKRLSPRGQRKVMLGLSRSQTMPGIYEEKLKLKISTQQAPLTNLNTADVEKVFDDLFEEATRSDDL